MADMNFSFESVISTPALDQFGISKLDAAAYELPAPSSTPGGKQRKPKKRRSTPAGDKPYPTIKCPECPKTYRDNAAGQRHLQLHMTTHDPAAQAKFSCDKCAKSFPNEVYLKRHWNLCGAAARRRRSSVGSSTHDESSNDSAAAAVAQKLDDVAERDGEVQIDFLAF